MIDLNNLQVATTKTARDINRRIVLNLIRKHQPVSRADISRLSRLQRSTVSAITEQLVAEGWVTTGACGDLPRGRKPTFLHLNSDRAGIVGIDIRPRETFIALTDLEMRFLAEDSMRTNLDPALLVKELGGRLSNLMNLHPHIAVEGVGVVLPGRVELPSSRLTHAPGLGWGPVDLKGPLEEATGLEVELENVANACALAEIWRSSHSEAMRNLVVITVSEDIGVGMIFNGQLIRGAMGMAGEFGHMKIEEDGPCCQCGNQGCFEVCASNTAAVRRFNELSGNKHHNRHGGEIYIDEILDLAERGNQHASEALNDMARSLGTGLAMIITGLAPDAIIVVGEMTRAWGRLGPLVNEVVRGQLRTKMPTRILPSTAGARARLHGAASLILQKHFGAVQLI